jgi:acetylornithine deacetylase/succinyl-diaminopimelate desuccinylase-like protein
MDLEAEATEVLQRLIRFNTVNPPGNERAALEYLASYLEGAGFEVELLGSSDERTNLVATLSGGPADGPVLGFLGHVDTVLADPSEWSRDPWSGDVADGFVWGRGALDMKSQVAAEAAAGAALGRSGWRPANGQLKLMFVCDEETGGSLGAKWLTEKHPDKVRCDLLLNEGGGEVFEYRGRRLYGVCCGEKGIFRFMVTARGVAGHASMPRLGDNALLNLVPVLSALGESGMVYDLTDAAARFLRGIGEDPSDPAGAIARIAEFSPELSTLVEPLLGITLTPTIVHASDKINVIPSRAYVKVDCRVPPGRGREAAERRVYELLDGAGRPDSAGAGAGADGLAIEFTETEVGNESPASSGFMDAITTWVGAHDPGAATVPVILPGASDSRFFREAFPECVVYGFFPQRYMTMLESAPLVHGADERIDVRDLGFATGFFADIAREVLG